MTHTPNPKFKVLSITLYDVEYEDGHKRANYLTTINKTKLVEDIEDYRRLLALKYSRDLNKTIEVELTYHNLTQ